MIRGAAFIQVGPVEQQAHSAALIPFAIRMAGQSVGAFLGMEAAFGISGRQAETRALVQWCPDQLQPDPGS